MYNDRSQTKPDRREVLEILNQRLPGRNLFELALEVGVPTHFGSKPNKGWVGQTIERVAGLSNNSVSLKDGLDFELKTTSLQKRDNSFEPKETIKVTQLNPNLVLAEEFFSSVLWNKLERLVLVGYWTPQNNMAFAEKILSITLEKPEVIDPIRAFWEDVKHLICSGEIKFHINLGTSDDLIQLRPLGDGKQFSVCPITGESFPARAFYLTKKMIKILMKEAAL
jgi:DNA mismatch repair protein MutH